MSEVWKRMFKVSIVKKDIYNIQFLGGKKKELKIR